MKFVPWVKGNFKAIFVNDIEGFSGKCYFRDNDGEIELLAKEGELTPEQKNEIYTQIDSQFGILKEYLTYDLLYSAVGKNTKASKRKPVQENKAKASEDLDILSVKMPEKVTVKIDHREPREIAQILASHPKINVIIQSLDVGDYIINDEVVIERKCCTSEDAATDFEQSIVGQDKRLFNQSESMKLHQGIIPIIILEGNCQENAKRMLVQQIDGAISFLAVIQRISVWSTYNLHHTAYTIAKLATHHKSGLGYELGLRSHKPEQLLDQRSFVLEGIPGINGKLAKMLLARFGSIKAIGNATKEEILGVDGIGEAKADKIIEIFR